MWWCCGSVDPQHIVFYGSATRFVNGKTTLRKQHRSKGSLTGRLTTTGDPGAIPGSETRFKCVESIHATDAMPRETPVTITSKEFGSGVTVWSIAWSNSTAILVTGGAELYTAAIANGLGSDRRLGPKVIGQTSVILHDPTLNYDFVSFRNRERTVEYLGRCRRCY